MEAGAEEQEREVGRKGRKGGRKRKEETGWTEVGGAGGRRRRDGGGAVHLQIKFVIQASDGPTARD